MGYEKEIEAVEREWSFEDGFFWHLRQGHFSAGEFERTLAALGAISISDNAELPLRLVSLLWYGPVFMHWQSERVQEAGGDLVAYENAIALITNEIERLLGLP